MNDQIVLKNGHTLIWAKAFMFSMFTLCLSACLLFVWLLFIDGLWNPPVKYWAGCFSTTRQSYHPGEAVVMHLYSTKSTDRTGQIAWELINNTTGQRWAYASRQGVLERGYQDKLTPPLFLPDNIPPGVYHLRGATTYEINGFRNMTFTTRSSDFEVVDTPTTKKTVRE